MHLPLQKIKIPCEPKNKVNETYCITGVNY
jgi:hypothetical protein